MKTAKPQQKQPIAKKRGATTAFETKKTEGQGTSIGVKAISPTKSEPPQKQAEKLDTRFKPGQSGNPAGKPVGTRNRLQGDFLRELSEDFDAHGKSAIIACRSESPAIYIKVIASLLPKEIEVKRPLEGLSEDELIAGVDALRTFLASQSDGSRAKATPSGKPATTVPAIH